MVNKLANSKSSVAQIIQQEVKIVPCNTKELTFSSCFESKLILLDVFSEFRKPIKPPQIDVTLLIIATALANLELAIQQYKCIVERISIFVNDLIGSELHKFTTVEDLIPLFHAQFFNDLLSCKLQIPVNLLPISWFDGNR